MCICIIIWVLPVNIRFEDINTYLTSWYVFGTCYAQSTHSNIEGDSDTASGEKFYDPEYIVKTRLASEGGVEFIEYLIKVGFVDSTHASC